MRHCYYHQVRYFEITWSSPAAFRERILLVRAPCTVNPVSLMRSTGIERSCEDVVKAGSWMQNSRKRLETKSELATKVPNVILL